MIYPDNFEQKIDFTTVREHIKALCTFALGREEIDRISFRTNLREIELMLDETNEMQRLLSDATVDVPMGNFYDLREDLARIRVEGLFLDEQELFSLRRTLEATRQLTAFFASLPEETYPQLVGQSAQVAPVDILLREMDKLLDKFGRIKDNASPELQRIRRELNSQQGSVSRLLASILRQAQADGYVDKDTTPTLREGRLVIPISPMYKRKLGGIVHDESATGKTIFVEPTQVVEANNRIRELEGEQRREVIRILTVFANYLRPHISDLLASQFFLGHIDFLQAKATFAIKTRSIRPEIVKESMIDWQQAKHPILLLTLQKQGKTIVPLDIRLNEQQRILVISARMQAENQCA